MKTKEIILSIIGSLTLFIGGMFMVEIKTFIITHYPIMIMCLGFFLICLAIVSIFIRYVFKQEAKSTFGDIVANNKRMGEVNDCFSKVSSINQVLIKEMLNTLDDEKLYEICKKAVKAGICYKNINNLSFLPNLQEYGIKNEIIKRLELYDLEQQKIKLTTNK